MSVRTGAASAKCRKCQSIESMDRQRARYAVDPNWRRDYHAANKETINRYVREYRAKRIAEDPSFRTKIMNAKYLADPIGFGRAWYAANKARHAEYQRRYDEAHPEVLALKATRRRACFSQIKNTLTARDIAEVFAEFNHACAYCLRTDRKLTVDHMDPVSKGGDNARENIVPACLSCNSAKGNRSIFWTLNR